MANHKLGEWIGEEKERLKTESKKHLKEMGFRPVMKLNKGVNEVTLDLNEKPRVIKTKFGKERHVLNLTNPDGMCLMVTSVLYSQIIEYVSETDNDRIALLRSGDGVDTRIELLKEEN